MEAFETSVLEEYGGIKPKMWLRFVDDRFVILDKRAGEDFFRFINNKDPCFIVVSTWFRKREITSNSLSENAGTLVGPSEKPLENDQNRNRKQVQWNIEGRLESLS